MGILSHLWKENTFSWKTFDLPDPLHFNATVVPFRHVYFDARARFSSCLPALRLRGRARSFVRLFSAKLAKYAHSCMERIDVCAPKRAIEIDLGGPYRVCSQY